MKNSRKISLFVVILLIFSSFNFIAFGEEVTEDSGKTIIEEFNEGIDFLKLVINFVLSEYLYEVSYNDILNGLYKGFFDVLDDYSVHYTAEEYQEFNTGLSGEFSGIGVQITLKNGEIVVVTPLPDTPAIKAGLKPNDVIFSVDDTDITGYSTDKAAELIRGETGTTVKIGVKRDGKIIQFDIVRDNIVVSSVYSETLEDGTMGYLRITQFNHNTCELVEEKLAEFDELGITKIVIDLRNNPGGSLSEVVDILNLFVPEGPLVYTQKAQGEEEVLSSTLSKTKYEISVLVNEGSASASEIFAGAVQDREAGEVVGKKTFGKGVVQSLFNLKNGHAVKFTTAEYFTANKNKVHGIGITPDIVVENLTGEPSINLSEYPELNKTRKPNVGVVGLDVLGAEMILQTLGYSVNEPDGVLDEVTFEQIKKFQIDNGLYGYGVLDFTTQDILTSEINKYAQPIVEDLQLQEAINCLK